MSFNDIFNKALIYVASHSEHGSVGLIINHFINEMPYKSVFKLLKSESDVESITLPIFLGGPLEPDRGFILHSAEYTKNLLFKLNSDLAVSSNVQILKDMAAGTGPKDTLFVMGYTGWGPSQLENELALNHWLIADMDLSIIFSEDHEQKWQIALTKLGITNNFLTSHLGHG